MYQVLIAGIFLLFANSLSLANNKEPLYRCQLNKSYSLEVLSTKNADGTMDLLLEERHFMGDLRNQVVLRNPQVVQYGNVFMATDNRGRFGYTFVRFEESYQGHHVFSGDVRGHIDSNLFGGEGSTLNTRGALKELPLCYKISI